MAHHLISTGNLVRSKLKPIRQLLVRLIKSKKRTQKRRRQHKINCIRSSNTGHHMRSPCYSLKTIQVLRRGCVWWIPGIVPVVDESIHYLNFNGMKKYYILCLLVFSVCLNVSAQSKTDLSLKVSAAAAANRAQLSGYVWTRTVMVFVEGVLKNTIVSSMSIGPDGKMLISAVSAVATDPPPTRGIRGNIASKKIAEMKTYVDDAVKVSMGYIYMSKGGMVNYFDAAGISQSGNTITVAGSSVNQPGDQLKMNIAAGSLAFISQSFSSTSDGDAISGNFNYKTFANGLTAFDSGELDLPAKSMK